MINAEVQGKPESGFPARMYRYHYRLRDRYTVEGVGAVREPPLTD